MGDMNDIDDMEKLLHEVRQCRVCEPYLPLGPRPVLQASATARLLITSQAPGTKVHESGIPFDDRSGIRLRDWMGVTDEEFYDVSRVAIMPMGFCYPGRANGGDAPPRPECAPLWRHRLLALMPDIKLTLLVGMYAQRAVLGSGRVDERVANFRDYLPDYFPLPHPSWRSHIWMKRNPWFESEVLPVLRQKVREALNGSADSQTLLP